MLMKFDPQKKYEFYKKAFEEKSKPLAYLDQEFFEENCRMILQRSAGKKIRIASKSIRCKSVLHKIFDFSTQFEGIMSYSAGEALFLLESGFDNILLGYPVVNKSEIEKFIPWLKKGKNVCFMADLNRHIDILESIGKKENIVLKCCLDIDMSYRLPFLNFGVWRSSITNLEMLEKRITFLTNKKNVKTVGIMGYEAQIAGLGDQLHGQFLKSKAINLLKKISIKKLRAFREDSIKLFESKGIRLEFVNGGGTGSLETTVTEKGVTEVTVGSGFYSPHLFDNYQSFKHLPAAAYMLEVVRKPKANIYTCMGGGYIASGESNNNKQPLPYLPPGFKTDPNEGNGEVQTPLHQKGNYKLSIGDPVCFRHAKAGELCEHFNILHFLKVNGDIEEMLTYRGEGKCFPA
ncbi:MAG: amino acid deaminase/aldolase [Chitinophagaceae bacterium]|nr:MAG: amino acid deaminase/aldolase [Chitinophagaceae bacterium]